MQAAALHVLRPKQFLVDAVPFEFLRDALTVRHGTLGRCHLSGFPLGQLLCQYVVCLILGERPRDALLSGKAQDAVDCPLRGPGTTRDIRLAQAFRMEPENLAVVRSDSSHMMTSLKGTRHGIVPTSIISRTVSFGRNRRYHFSGQGGFLTSDWRFHSGGIFTYPNCCNCPIKSFLFSSGVVVGLPSKSSNVSRNIAIW